MYTVQSLFEQYNVYTVQSLFEQYNVYTVQSLFEQKTFSLIWFPAQGVRSWETWVICHDNLELQKSRNKKKQFHKFDMLQ